MVLNFLPLFVTKNGILQFSAFGLTKWSYVKISKRNHSKYIGCGSENLDRLNFYPFFNQKVHFMFFRFYIHKLMMSQKEKSYVNIKSHSTPNTVEFSDAATEVRVFDLLVS